MLSQDLSTVPLGEILDRFAVSGSYGAKVADTYPFRITAHYASLIKRPGDPVWLQSVPSIEELADDGQLPDPLEEARLSPVPGLIHRYPDRVVLLVANRCAVYCRFCMRKRQVGCGTTGLDTGKALEYIGSRPEITDILLSGGDPLTLPVDILNDIIKRLRLIPHIQTIRIGSRIPVVEPDGVTPELCRMLAGHHPLFINTHFNHPVEINSESARACSMLADAGIPLGNQTVLMRGVNDDPSVMAELCLGLLRIRVRPYYLHQMDLVRGTSHFRTPLSVGMDMVRGMRGKIPGMAIPHFVLDLPGGKGKVAVPDAVVSSEGGLWNIRTGSGGTVSYRDPL